MDDIQRERALFLYRNAIERGDAATVDRVLQLAETDAGLENMILESHALDSQEFDAELEILERESADDWAPAAIRGALALHLGDDVAGQGNVPALEQLAPPTISPKVQGLTLADVAAQMQLDSAQRPTRAQSPAAEFAHLTQRLRQLAIPLPERIDERALTQLFHNLGLVVSSEFQANFRETALVLHQKQERR